LRRSLPANGSSIGFKGLGFCFGVEEWKGYQIGVKLVRKGGEIKEYICIHKDPPERWIVGGRVVVFWCGFSFDDSLN